MVYKWLVNSIKQSHLKGIANRFRIKTDIFTLKKDINGMNWNVNDPARF